MLDLFKRPADRGAQAAGSEAIVGPAALLVGGIAMGASVGLEQVPPVAGAAAAVACIAAIGSASSLSSRPHTPAPAPTSAPHQPKENLIPSSFFFSFFNTHILRRFQLANQKTAQSGNVLGMAGVAVAFAATLGSLWIRDPTIGTLLVRHTHIAMLTVITSFASPGVRSDRGLGSWWRIGGNQRGCCRWPN